ncbi:MAG: hypothetical protein R2861_11010 [Desulfobacterales bacterium]
MKTLTGDLPGKGGAIRKAKAIYGFLLGHVTGGTILENVRRRMADIMT